MSEGQPDKPKIIVDDDWKERVRAERAAFKEQQQATPAGDESAGGDAASHEIPPASFSLMVTSLATQTLASLGQISGPEDKEPLVRLDVARHHIDMLDVLEEKTRGNLTPEESSMLTNLLHELRMVFIAVQGSGAQATE